MADNHEPDDEPKSVLAEAEAAKATRPTPNNRTRRIVTGAAIGIGSAALVAALLYGNRARKGDKA